MFFPYVLHCGILLLLTCSFVLCQRKSAAAWNHWNVYKSCSMHEMIPKNLLLQNNWNRIILLLYVPLCIYKYRYDKGWTRTMSSITKLFICFCVFFDSTMLLEFYIHVMCCSADKNGKLPECSMFISKTINGPGLQTKTT